MAFRDRVWTIRDHEWTIKDHVEAIRDHVCTIKDHEDAFRNNMGTTSDHVGNYMEMYTDERQRQRKYRNRLYSQRLSVNGRKLTERQRKTIR